MVLIIESLGLIHEHISNSHAVTDNQYIMIRISVLIHYFRVFFSTANSIKFPQGDQGPALSDH